jgi:hypothetical protein
MKPNLSAYPAHEDLRPRWFQDLVKRLNRRTRTISYLAGPLTSTAATQTVLTANVYPAIIDMQPPGSSLKFRVWGTTAANANNKQFKIDLSATSGLYVAYWSTAAALNAAYFVLQGEIMRQTTGVLDGWVTLQTSSALLPQEVARFSSVADADHYRIYVSGVAAADFVIGGAKLEFSEDS